MKKILTIIFALTTTIAANAMSREQAREQAIFLTDKMAYELNLTEDQYEAAYEINYDYLCGIRSEADVFGTYWTNRNADLSVVLVDWQYAAFCDAVYFYRPIYWGDGYWHFRIYGRYPVRDFFYFARPAFVNVYVGGHCWVGHSGGWYRGRTWGVAWRSGGCSIGMRDGYRGTNNHGHFYSRGTNGNYVRNSGNVNITNVNNTYINNSNGRGTNSRFNRNGNSDGTNTGTNTRFNRNGNSDGTNSGTNTRFNRNGNSDGTNSGTNTRFNRNGNNGSTDGTNTRFNRNNRGGNSSDGVYDRSGYTNRNNSSGNTSSYQPRNSSTRQSYNNSSSSSNRTSSFGSSSSGMNRSSNYSNGRSSGYSSGGYSGSSSMRSSGGFSGGSSMRSSGGGGMRGGGGFSGGGMRGGGGFSGGGRR